ncbi:MAG: hypothetical protein JXA15_04590 [Spirochaetales bacterium]|nr:hypothetical protein [Spirochaetales bacterium]
MKKTTLAIPFEDPLARSILDESARAGREVFAFSRGDAGADAAPLGSCSFAAARAAVMAATNRLGNIDSALLVLDPKAGDAPETEDPPGPRDVERTIDSRLKGPVHLIRELMAEFDRAGSGRLVIAVRVPDEGLADPLSSLVDGALRAWVRGLFATMEGKPWFLLGVELRGADDDQALLTLRKLLEGDAARLAGRWHRVGGRSGLFGAFQA